MNPERGAHKPRAFPCGEGELRRAGSDHHRASEGEPVPRRRRRPPGRLPRRRVHLPDARAPRHRPSHAIRRARRLHCDADLGIAPEHNLAFRAARAFSAALRRRRARRHRHREAHSRRCRARRRLVGRGRGARRSRALGEPAARRPRACTRWRARSAPTSRSSCTAALRSCAAAATSSFARLPDVAVRPRARQARRARLHGRGVPGVRRESAAAGATSCAWSRRFGTGRTRRHSARRSRTT